MSVRLFDSFSFKISLTADQLRTAPVMDLSYLCKRLDTTLLKKSNKKDYLPANSIKDLKTSALPSLADNKAACTT